MKLYESGENYLETIFRLEKRNGTVRSIDVANELNYSKPSISRAMKILKSAGNIEFGETGEIILTPEGREIAKGIYERHRFIYQYLIMTLDVDEKLADIDACRIEHIISEETFQGIKNFVLSKQ